MGEVAKGSRRAEARILQGWNLGILLGTRTAGPLTLQRAGRPRSQGIPFVVVFLVTESLLGAWCGDTPTSEGSRQIDEFSSEGKQITRIPPC